MTHTPIPDIPGVLLENEAIRGHLADKVAQLCGLTQTKFPGSQPISFTLSSLNLLESKDFWVCEKSDGVRVLVFIVMNHQTGNQEVWLIDRKQRYFNIEDLHFPHWERADDPLTDTILDGELVIDIDPRTGVEKLRFYAFDCLVLHGENIMKKPLVKRFARLRDWVVNPFVKALQTIPEWRESLPFEVLAKVQELSYYVTQVLNVHIPQLQHGHDGLIFTCAESEYVCGTDDHILKWKPPSENSIDFKLELRFPPTQDDRSQPDYSLKPIFALHTWLGGDSYEFYDEMEVNDDEWEKMKESGEQYDDRIIEVAWDTERGSWRMMRIRDDKPNANHKSIMQKIIISIEDGVEIETLLSRTDAIRAAWKARATARSGNPPPAQPQRRPTQAAPQPPTPGNRANTGPGYPATPGSGFAPPQQGVMAGLKR